jgi:hypothetical protein
LRETCTRDAVPARRAARRRACFSASASSKVFQAPLTGVRPGTRSGGAWLAAERKTAAPSAAPTAASAAMPAPGRPLSAPRCGSATSEAVIARRE